MEDPITTPCAGCGMDYFKSEYVLLAATIKKLLKIKKMTSDTKNLICHTGLSLLLLCLKKYAYHME